MSSTTVETSLLKAAESGIAPKPEAPKRRLGLVVALVLGSFALGATVATAAKGVLARKATNLSACDGLLAVGDAVELQNLNAAPALNGMTGVITAIDGGITKVKMDDGGSVRNVPAVKVKATGCPDLDKVAWPVDSICFEGFWFPDMSRTGQCLGWCGVMLSPTQPQCKGGTPRPDVEGKKIAACCPEGCPDTSKMPACKWY